MITGSQKVRWSDSAGLLVISATISGRFVETDYGVDRSPVFLELEECEVEWPIEVNGEDRTRDWMVYTFGEEFTSNTEELLCGQIDDDSWIMDD